MGASSNDTLTRADAQTYLKQFPFTGYLPWALHLLPVVASNGYVLWLMLQGRLSGPGLILIVVIETVLLTVLARLAALPIPRADWLEQPKPLKETLPLLLFLIVWCSGAYGITLLMIDGWPEMLRFTREPSIWIDSGVAWAIGITTLLALLTMVGDWTRYRRHGAPYIAALSHDVMARMLTLIFGAIPFAMPFFVVTIGGFKAVEWIAKRARHDPAHSALAGLAMLGVGWGGFLLVGQLIAIGTHGWAIGYLLAKLVSELMVAAIPLVMHIVASAPEAAIGTGTKGQAARR